MPKKIIIDTPKEFAITKGGRCKSDVYVRSKSKLEWECSEGHSWMATWDNVRRGKWCPECAAVRRGKNRRVGIDIPKAFAITKGGRCKSDVYVNANSKLSWECSEGHSWETDWRNVRQGKWCPKCAIARNAENRRIGINLPKAFAIAKGGRCKSDVYVNANSKLEWECSERHTWLAKWSHIKSGSWCPKCASGNSEEITRVFFEELLGVKFDKAYPDWLKNSDNNQMEFDGYNEKLGVAFEHHGEQHYSDLPFFQRGKNTLKKRRKDDRRKKYLAKKHGVKLIIVPQLGSRTRIENLKAFLIKRFNEMDIRIDEKSIPEVIDFSGVYKTDKFKKLHDRAGSKGGFCDPTGYVNAHTKILWGCADNHTWMVSWGKISQGSWCPECYKKTRSRSQRTGIEAPKTFAATKGGKCKSNVYINARTPMEWECHKEHSWEAAWGNVKGGTWCPECNKIRRSKAKN